METLHMFTRLSLCVLLLVSLGLGAQGARVLSYGHALPSCKDVPGGIQYWDCYDPPSTPLPPCDYKHQNPGIDCRVGGRASKVRPQSDASVAGGGFSDVQSGSTQSGTHRVRG